MTLELCSRRVGEMMSEVPSDLYYTAEHEWIRVEGNDVVVGITDYAQDALTDIVYVELPDEDMQVAEMDEFASVESVKSVSAIFAPLAGTISAVNEELDDEPELINQDPYGKGWIARITIEDTDVLKQLMSAAAYVEQIGE